MVLNKTHKRIYNKFLDMLDDYQPSKCFFFQKSLWTIQKVEVNCLILGDALKILKNLKKQRFEQRQADPEDCFDEEMEEVDSTSKEQADVWSNKDE